MNNWTIRMLEFREYEGEAFTRYLNEMAGQGWFLKKLRGGFLWFEHGEPGTRRYLAAAMPGVSVFDGEDNWETKRFRKRYEEAGWKLQCSRVTWQIFYRDAVDGECVYQGMGDTEEISGETRLNTLRQLKSTSLSLGKIASALLIMGLLFWLVSMQFQNPGQGFASNRVLLSTVLIAAIWFVYPVQLVMTACWYRKAERMLKQTGKLPEVSLKHIRLRSFIGSCYLALVLLLLYITTQNGAMRYAGTATLLTSILVGVAVFLVNTLVLRWVREHGSGDRRENAIGYGVGSVLIGMMIVMLMSGVIMRFMPDSQQESVYQRQGEFPVDFPELGFEAADDWYRGSSRSIFGFYQREAGVRTGEEGQEEYLVLEYYESRIPAVIVKTRELYPKDKGNVMEGGNRAGLLRRLEEMKESGVTAVCLLAIADGGKPCYDAQMVQRIAGTGIPCFACNPQKLPELLERALKGQDLMALQKEFESVGN